MSVLPPAGLPAGSRRRATVTNVREDEHDDDEDERDEEVDHRAGRFREDGPQSFTGAAMGKAGPG
jgi:hypothetical protein